ncbi:MAG: PepSY domain-containing protein [Alphaproteobacteria bacterium]|nr:PepSY domain-containing protein [Alphaproteobacteria bacterium]
MTTTRTRLAALSLCLVAGLAALPAMAESDNHVVYQGAASGAVAPNSNNNRNPDPSEPPLVYNPVTGTTGYYAPAPVPLPAPVVLLNDSQIAQSLTSQGYRRVRDIQFDGTHYTAHARDGRNRQLALVVSAETGQVLDARYVR